MDQINAYLTFDGNCRQAMEFYAKCLGAQVHLMPFGEAGAHFPVNANSKDRILHARLTHGAAVLMASDTMPGMPYTTGSNFSVSVNCQNKQETDKFFTAMSENGKVTMPLQDTFWGAYFGMVTDQFGIQWMFNFDKPQK